MDPFRSTDLPNPSELPGEGDPGRAEAVPAEVRIEGYRLIDTLGVGGMGVVYRAEQLSTRRLVALKVLPATVGATERRRERFRLEVELASALQHPNIATVYDSGLSHGTYYYAMELVEGVPLDAYVRDNDLGLRQVLALVKTVVEAVQHAHFNGVIHRDLKPTNILVDQHGQPHVLDFGLAKAVREPADAVTLSLEGDITGTPAYMSPEQAGGRTGAIDTRTDIYSLGVVLCEALTGRNPHPLEGSRMEVLRGIEAGRRSIDRSGRFRLDGDLAALLDKALAVQPADRYASAAELAEDIDAYLDGRPLRARRSRGIEPALKWIGRHRKAAALTALLLALLTGMIVYHNRRLADSLRRQTAARHEAEQALRQLEVAHLRSRLVPLDRASLVDQLNNLELLAAFENDHPELVDPGLARRLVDERTRLAERVDEALLRNKLGDLLAVLAGDARLPRELAALDRARPNANCTPRLRQRLENTIVVPLPRHRAQTVLDAVEGLRRLAPDSPAPQQALARLRAWRDTFPLVERQDFDGGTPGAPVPDWTELFPPAARYDKTGTHMVLESTYSNSSSSYRQITNQADTLIVRCTLWMDEPTGDAPPGVNAQLALFTDGVSEGVCSLQAIDGHFTRSYPDRMGGVKTVKAWPAEPGRRYAVEMRVHDRRGTVDILVDGRFLLEEAPVLVRKRPVFVMASAIKGTTLHLDDFEIRRADDLVKQDWGQFNLARTFGTMPVRRMRWWDYANWHSPLVHDLDGDGRPELLMGWNRRSSRPILGVYRVDTDRMVLQEAAEVDCGPWIDAAPVGAVGNRVGLALKGRFGLSKLERPGDAAIPTHAFGLYEFDKDLSSRRLFTSTLRASNPTQMLPMNFGDGTDGLAVLHGYGERGVELFRNLQGPGPPLERIGLYHPTGGTGRPSDILTGRTIDIDGDGGTDLVLGLGPWSGYCPLLVRLTGASLDDGRRLADPPMPGITTVALSRFDTPVEHLVGATTVSRLSEGQVLKGSGLRLYRHENDTFRLLQTLPGDYSWVVEGTVLGRQVVVATKWTGYGRPDGNGNLAIQMYGLEGDSLTRLWELTVFDCPGKQGGFSLYHGIRPLLGDLDGDGNDELLLVSCEAMHQFGTLALQFGER